MRDQHVKQHGGETKGETHSGFFTHASTFPAGKCLFDRTVYVKTLPDPELQEMDVLDRALSNTPCVSGACVNAA